MAEKKGASAKSMEKIVRSRPADLNDKKGQQGRRLNLISNYFRIRVQPDWNIFQYHVSFEPDIESTGLRKGLIKEYGGFSGYVFDGTKIFSCFKLKENVKFLNVASKQGDKFKITLKYVGIISTDMYESLHVLNVIMRRAMEGLNLKLVGRNYFDPQAKLDMQQYRLQIWPGYITSIRQHESEILLCAQVAHKIMRSESLLDIYANCMRNSRNAAKDFANAVLNTIVLTPYNNETYRILNVEFEKNPSYTFKSKNSSISIIDYYSTKYHIQIRDKRQPLLLAKGKHRASDASNPEKEVLLVPELCLATGLSDQMRNDFQLMRTLAAETGLNPIRRQQRLNKFNQRLMQSKESAKVFNDWQLNLDQRLVNVSGRVLKAETIVFSKTKAVSAGNNAEWSRQFRNGPLLKQPAEGLKKWICITNHQNERTLGNFIEQLKIAAKGMCLPIMNPNITILNDDRVNSYVNACNKAASSDPQLILVLVPNVNAERYTSVKKNLCLANAIPSQVVTAKIAGNQKNLLSVATKVAIQINCKLGYSPWGLEMPLAGLMTVGYYVSKSIKDSSKAYCALVATMDMKTNPTFYSTVAPCSAFDIIATNLWPMMVKALRQYRLEHKALPARILFYRDGLSDGMLQQVFETEVKEFLTQCRAEYAKAKAPEPLISYIAITKQVNTRFFDGERNPPPGTVIDDVVTLPERFDFYLISQDVKQGTVSPTSYNVLYSNIKLAPDQIQTLTYKFCHLYFNWPGTTRVPAVCQYANKLATLVGTNLFGPPHASLEKKLFYL